jgi:hypothetical protein
LDNLSLNGSSTAGIRYSAGLYLLGAVTLLNSKVFGGAGFSSSVAIYANTNSVSKIKGNLILGGDSPSYANGVIIYTTDTILDSNKISGDFAITVGNHATPTVINNLIYSTNSGIYNNNGSSIIKNNTIISADRGILNQNLSTPTIENNIISATRCILEASNNSDPVSVKNNNLVGCTIFYTDFENGCTGNGDGDNDDSTCTLVEMELLTDVSVSAASQNISQDPQLVDLAGPDSLISTIEDNDWHLQITSPTAVTTGALTQQSYLYDLDNITRTGTWSIGAYEYD